MGQGSRMTRREVLRLGGACGLALTLPDLLRAQSAPCADLAPTFGQAKSVIVLYLHGGHAQQETWDPKPDGPSPARGEFGAIATSVPGVRVGELLPLSARLMHKLAVIRSLSHGNANHVQASLAALTGHAHPPETEARGDFPPSPADFPPFGAVLSQRRSAAALPTWVQVGPLMRRNNGTVLHGQLPGFLGLRYSPFAVDQDLLPADVRIAATASNPDVPILRLTDRGRLLDQVEQQRRQLDRAAELTTFDTFHRRAFNLLSAPATARAFDLAGEPAGVRAVWPHAIRPALLAGATAGGSGRAADQRELLPHAGRFMGHAQPALPPDEGSPLPNLRPGVRSAGGRS